MSSKKRQAIEAREISIRNNLFEVYKNLSISKPVVPGFGWSDKSVRIKDIINKREQLKNQSLETDIALKKMTLIVLFIFLGLETCGIFTFAYFQATKFQGFALEEWSFKILVLSTILQITYMLKIAVQHLFPNGSGNIK